MKKSLIIFTLASNLLQAKSTESYHSHHHWRKITTIIAIGIAGGIATGILCDHKNPHAPLLPIGPETTRSR